MAPHKTILFICEHGAAKSVIAATYFNRIANESGLNWKASARGTNPDTELSKTTVSGLGRDKLEPGTSHPQKLLPEDMQSAHKIISFCNLSPDYTELAVIEKWENVPPVNQDYDAARDVILERIHDLLNKLRSSS